MLNTETLKPGNQVFTDCGTIITIKKVRKYGVYDQNDDYWPGKEIFELTPFRQQIKDAERKAWKEWKEKEHKVYESLGLV